MKMGSNFDPANDGPPHTVHIYPSLHAVLDNSSDAWLIERAQSKTLEAELT